MSEYKTRQGLIEDGQRLRGALSEILDEASKPNPNLGFIEDTASDALDIDDEDEDDIEDSDEDSEEDDLDEDDED